MLIHIFRHNNKPLYHSHHKWTFGLFLSSHALSDVVGARLPIGTSRSYSLQDTYVVFSEGKCLSSPDCSGVLGFKMDDCNLEKLVIKPGKLSPAFHRDTTEYNVTLPSNVTKIHVDPLTSDTGASYCISVSSGLVYMLGLGSQSITVVNCFLVCGKTGLWKVDYYFGWS